MIPRAILYLCDETGDDVMWISKLHEVQLHGNSVSAYIAEHGSWGYKGMRHLEHCVIVEDTNLPHPVRVLVHRPAELPEPGAFIALQRPGGTT